MKLSDLPVLPKSNHDTHDCVIVGGNKVLIDELDWLYFIGDEMADPIITSIMDVLWSSNCQLVIFCDTIET